MPILHTEDGLPVTSSNPLPTNPAALSSSTDGVDVDLMTKGTVTTAANAISSGTTSSEISCVGYNSILLQVILSTTGQWDVTITGSMTSGGTFTAWNVVDNGTLVAMSTLNLTASAGYTFTGVPDYIKVVTNEDSGSATCTVYVQPFNV